jgi:hypothetical protein
MTGEGSLQSATDPSRSANFEFEYSITNFADGSGRLTGTYHDGAIKLRFDGAESSPPVTPGSTCIDTTRQYVSQSHESPGNGSLMLVACATSGHGQPGLFDIQVTTGPFAGYENLGPTTRGHLTVHG